MITLPHVHPFRYVTTIVMIVSSLATGIGTSSAQAGTDALVATTTLELEAGEMTWQAVVASTISESEPPVPIEPGFVAALDDPLLLLFEAGARLERVPADAAFAVPAPLEGHPVAMLADAPVPYLGVDLGEFDVGTADPESAPFPVEAGDYELTLWRLDPALPLAPEYIERLGALELPMLAYVREGASRCPFDDGGRSRAPGDRRLDRDCPGRHARAGRRASATGPAARNTRPAAGRSNRRASRFPAPGRNHPAAPDGANTYPTGHDRANPTDHPTDRCGDRGACSNCGPNRCPGAGHQRR